MTEITRIKEKIKALKYKAEEKEGNFEHIWNMAISKAMECCDELEGDR